MLTLLISLLSSTGVGSIIGLLGGLANRYMDQKNKAQDYNFELAKMDKEREQIKEEYAARLTIATTETEGKIEEAGYGAMAASYGFANTTKEDGTFINGFSKFIRPFLTLAFFFFTIYVFYEVSNLVSALELKPSPTEVWNLYVYIIQWIFFQSGAAIGWWFAMRPGKYPIFVK